MPSETRNGCEIVRVVLDTNVLVSALIHEGKPRKLLSKLLEKHTVILSQHLMAEFADVVSRDKFVVKDFQVDRFLSDLVSMSKIVADNPVFKAVLEDPDDDVVLNAAVAGKADLIVSGDRHLLKLECFKGIRIVSVVDMLEILEN